MKYSIKFEMVNQFLIIAFDKKGRNRRCILLQKRFSSKTLHKIKNSTKHFRLA